MARSISVSFRCSDVNAPRQKQKQKTKTNHRKEKETTTTTTTITTYLHRDPVLNSLPLLEPPQVPQVRFTTLYLAADFVLCIEVQEGAANFFPRPAEFHLAASFPSPPLLGSCSWFLLHCVVPTCFAPLVWFVLALTTPRPPTPPAAPAHLCLLSETDLCSYPGLIPGLNSRLVLGADGLPVYQSMQPINFTVRRVSAVRFCAWFGYFGKGFQADYDFAQRACNVLLAASGRGAPLSCQWLLRFRRPTSAIRTRVSEGICRRTLPVRLPPVPGVCCLFP